jgi:hypothetical protein
LDLAGALVRRFLLLALALFLAGFQGGRLGALFLLELAGLLLFLEKALLLALLIEASLFLLLEDALLLAFLLGGGLLFFLQGALLVALLLGEGLRLFFGGAVFLALLVELGLGPRLLALGLLLGLLREELLLLLELLLLGLRLLLHRLGRLGRRLLGSTSRPGGRRSFLLRRLGRGAGRALAGGAALPSRLRSRFPKRFL